MHYFMLSDEVWVEGRIVQNTVRNVKRGGTKHRRLRRELKRAPGSPEGPQARLVNSGRCVRAIASNIMCVQPQQMTQAYNK